MIFDDMYPDAEVFTHFDFEGTEIVKSQYPGKCWYCNNETYFVDIYFGKHLCSEECNRCKWAEYNLAALMPLLDDYLFRRGIDSRRELFAQHILECGRPIASDDDLDREWKLFVTLSQKS